MPSGIVKVFHRSRGYGFIRCEAGGEDIFVHRRALEAAGIKHLRKGLKVSFDLANDLGRPYATRLRLETKPEANGVSVDLSSPQSVHVDAVDEKPDKRARKLISRMDLEHSLAEAVRSVAPECQAFVGVIIERMALEISGGANWCIKGVRYGKADRDRSEAALGIALHEMLFEYVLSDDHEDT